MLLMGEVVDEKPRPDTTVEVALGLSFLFLENPLC